MLPNGADVDYGASRGNELVVSSTITIAAASVLVVVRPLTKRFVMHTPGWDDCKTPSCFHHISLITPLDFSVIALGFAIVRIVGNVICMILLSLNAVDIQGLIRLVVKTCGVGHHQYDAPRQHLHHFLSMGPYHVLGIQKCLLI